MLVVSELQFIEQSCVGLMYEACIYSIWWNSINNWFLDTHDTVDITYTILLATKIHGSIDRVQFFITEKFIDI
jgi:hypothetical protein